MNQENETPQKEAITVTEAAITTTVIPSETDSAVIIKKTISNKPPTTKRRRGGYRRELVIDDHKPSKELEWSFGTLFRYMDRDKTGELTLEKVREAYASWDLPSEYAEALMKHCGDENKVIKFSRFLYFFAEKEKKVKELFHRLDTGNDGHLTIAEVKHALEGEGVYVNNEDLVQFVSFIDRDCNGVVTYDEWRDFLLLFPFTSANIANVYHFVSTVSLVDIGEGAIIPEGITFKEMGKYFLAGGIAGTSSRTATAPLDRLKILLQIQSTSKNVKYKGIVHGLKTIYKESGFLGFYRGNGVNAMKIAPETAVKFFAYEQAKRWLCPESERITIQTRLIAGGVAGLTSQAAIYPLELMKTRLITQEVPQGFVKTFLGIWRNEGPMTFFQGIRPALLGVIPYAALDLTVFETLKRHYISTYDRPPSAMVMLGCGTISSATGVIAVYPLSLVRTRLQVQKTVNGVKEYSGMFDVFRKTYKNEGVRGFYKGLTPNLLKVVPAASISYLVYETAKSFLELR